MKVEINIPPLGESISEATISRFIKPSGSFVALDEEIIELETDKVNQVLYASQKGQIFFSVEVGQSVPIGHVIGYIDTEAKGQEAPAVAVAPQPVKEPPKTQAPSAAPTPAQPTKPLAAARISETEFVASLSAPVPAPAPTPIKAAVTGTSRRKMSSLRKVIASRLVEVKNTTAMLTTFNEIDLSQVIAIRSQEKENFAKMHGAKLGFMSFFVKATVSALKTVPAVNAMIDGDEIVSYDTYDIGVAVSTEKGLMVPVIRGCDNLSFAQIEQALEVYAKKARSSGITIDDLKGGSFTITNGGVFGSLLSTPILNPPQSAILGMHSIVKRAVVVDDQIVIRPMMYVALSYDHRLIDGKEAVLFLAHIKHCLEEPSRLLLDL